MNAKPLSKKLLENTATFCQKFPYIVIAIFAICSALSIYVSFLNLSVTTETDKLFSQNLEWKKLNNRIEELFPGEKNTLVAIITGKTPEEGREVAKHLKDKLSTDKQNFLSVDDPASNPFYTSHGLEFLPTEDLDKLLNSLVAAQPFLGILNQDPSAAGLFKALSMLSLAAEHGQNIPSSFLEPLKGMARTLNNEAHKDFTPLSWQNLLAPDLSAMGVGREFVVTHPRRDFSSLQPSENATRVMRHAIDEEPLVKSGRVSVLLTGEAKINDEEFSTVADGMVTGVILSLGLVTLWLVWAVRTIRIIIPVLITLVIGLLLTTGFAAVAVGTLNLISVAFAILFVGIAVDFAIQFSVRFRGSDQSSVFSNTALIKTTSECGGQIFVASLATSTGFLAFVPTSFVGVAQLGLIAGVGMIIAFVCTLTLLPALLVLFKAKTALKEKGFQCLSHLDGAVYKKRRLILLIFAVIGAVGIFSITRLTFDSDPLHTKNPNTEGMRALTLLKANPLTTPYNAQIIVSDIETARKQAEEISKLPQVHDVMWIGSMVPENQPEKLDLIRDTAEVLLPTLDPPLEYKAPSPSKIRESAKATAAALLNPKINLPPLMRDVGNSIETISKMNDEDILRVNQSLTRYLASQIQMLKEVLQPTEVTLDNIPQSIRDEYITPDGEYLLVVHPKGDIGSPASLRAFADPIKKINPKIGGSAIEIQGSAETITQAFIIAAISALGMITFILLVALRHIKDTILVLLPLILSTLATVIWLVFIPEPLNYANVIALPLLLGVGVSFNIYFVMNWRAGRTHPLASPTARAVLFSALTTGSAFGTLALSTHTGTASMGRVLLYSLFCTLFCSLVFLPALLAQIGSPSKKSQ